MRLPHSKYWSGSHTEGVFSLCHEFSSDIMSMLFIIIQNYNINKIEINTTSYYIVIAFS